MRNVYLLCGIIGSGKSTWAKENAERLNAYIVCKDNIREMIYGKYEFNPAQESFVDCLAWTLIKWMLVCGKNVIIDDCYSAINQKARSGTTNDIKTWCDVIQSSVKVTALNFRDTSEKCLERRMENPRGYDLDRWAGVYEKMKEKFVPASIEEEHLDDVKEVLIVFKS